MSVMDFIGIIKDHLKSINCPMMRLNEYNKFDDLDSLYNFSNDINSYK